MVKRHRPWIAVSRVDDQAGVVAEIDDIDHATVVGEYSGSDLVLKSSLDVVSDEDLLGHRYPGIEDDRARVPFDLARGNPWEPLVQSGRVPGQRPHRGSGSVNANLVANRAECHIESIMVQSDRSAHSSYP